MKWPVIRTSGPTNHIINLIYFTSSYLIVSTWMTFNKEKISLAWFFISVVRFPYWFSPSILLHCCAATLSLQCCPGQLPWPSSWCTTFIKVFLCFFFNTVLSSRFYVNHVATVQWYLTKPKKILKHLYFK